MYSRSSVRGFVCALALLASMATGSVRAHDVGCATSTTGGGDWPQFGMDLGGSHHQTAARRIDAIAAARLEPVWTFDANLWSRTANNEITGYPIIESGCVYVGSSTGPFSNGQSPPGWVFAINADTGELVWRTKVDGGVYSSLAVQDGVVFAFVSRVGSPFVAALDQATGHVLWERTVDRQIGSDAVSSPVVYDNMVWVGVSGTAAEIDEGDRATFQGSFSLLDASPRCAASTTDLKCANPTAGASGGSLLAKTFTIPDTLWADGYAGGSIWSTIAIDEISRYGFVGTGNPFNYDSEHEQTNALIKIDLDRNRSLGQIVGSYKGNVEEYFPELAETAPCEDLEESPAFALGLECLRLDLDFGAQPNVFRDANGALRVGIGQKSGVYHMVDGDTMAPLWKALLGHPSAVGGIVGSAAFDDTRVYGPHTVGGYLWSIDRAGGTPQWLSPIADGVHWGPPVTLANDVLYTVDLKGFIDAYDADTGVPLLHRPIPLGAHTHADPAFSWGGATVARDTVYVSVGVGLTSAGLPSMPNGFVVAFRPPYIPIA